MVAEPVCQPGDEAKEGEDERLKRLRDDVLLARNLSIQVQQEADDTDEDYERARRERTFQLNHQRNRAALQEIKDQLERDHAETDQIKKEEARLLAV